RILEFINSQGVKLDSINAGVVITGGCAKLAGIREFLERYLDMPARIGYPTGVIGLNEKIQDPSFSTSVGLLKLACGEQFSGKKDLLRNSQENGLVKGRTDIRSLFDKIKEFFKDVI
ncbi:MAG: cell division protein FtsA, partial [Hydrogenobacter sp.]